MKLLGLKTLLLFKRVCAVTQENFIQCEDPSSLENQRAGLPSPEALRD